MDIVLLLLGIILVLAGHQLFWVFIGIAGFMAGYEWGRVMFPAQESILMLVVAIVIGLVGAGISVFFYHLAIILAGFLAGGYLGVSLVELFVPAGAIGFGLIFLLGGLAGAILMLWVFDWALMILSSLVGALLILNPFNLDPTLKLLLLALIVCLGLVVQVNNPLGKPPTVR